MPTITAGGQHVGEVRTFLETYCGESEDEWLVTIEGVKYQIVDIGMRMLQPHELIRRRDSQRGTSLIRTTVENAMQKTSRLHAAVMQFHRLLQRRSCAQIFLKYAHSSGR